MSEPTSGRPNRRGRRVLAWVASALAALGLLAGGIETIARASVDEQLASRAPEGVRIETTGLVLPGLLTGQVSVRASIDASGLALLGMDSVTGIDQAIEVTRVRHTPIGAVPIVVRLSPTVTGGHLGFSVVAATVGGIPVSVDGIRAPSPSALARVQNCILVTAAGLSDGRLVVDGRLPLRVDGSTRCH